MHTSSKEKQRKAIKTGTYPHTHTHTRAISAVAHVCMFISRDRSTRAYTISHKTKSLQTENGRENVTEKYFRVPLSVFLQQSLKSQVFTSIQRNILLRYSLCLCLSLVFNHFLILFPFSKYSITI